jgi:hypothetical protein
MSELQTIEQRLTEVEKEIADLKRRLPAAIMFFANIGNRFPNSRIPDNRVTWSRPKEHQP